MTKIHPGMPEIQARTCGRRLFARESCHAEFAYVLYMTAERDICMFWPESLPSLDGFESFFQF
jgi:hypothetical protein